MKVGIIGAGMIVHDFLSFAKEVEGMELVALCATPAEEDKVKELCDKHNIKKYYLDVDKMLQDDDVEVAYVAVPNHLHYAFCKKAMEAGKHAICEKPFTSNDKELNDLMRIAKEKEVILVEAVSTQYLPNTLKIKEALKDLGNIKIVSANYSQYSSRYDAFKEGNVMPAFNPEMSGGALMDLNIYNINFVVALFGKPQRVDYQANVEKGIDTSGILTLDYGTFKCVCIAAKDCKAPVSTNIQGDKGCINITTPVNNLNDYTVLMNDASAAKQMDANGGNKFDYNNGKHRMYHEFVEFVKMIDGKDFERANKMLDISLITMEIQTEARKKAGVVFAADK
ncbi:MAG: Gfo/Idh/MocA family protein [Coprobacillaceae bacterium]